VNDKDDALPLNAGSAGAGIAIPVVTVGISGAAEQTSTYLSGRFLPPVPPAPSRNEGGTEQLERATAIRAGSPEARKAVEVAPIHVLSPSQRSPMTHRPIDRNA
jgi:hypothetical protein